MPFINQHVAPGLGDMMPGWFAVPRNPIAGAGSNVTGRYYPTIGEMVAASFTVPQNPVKDAMWRGVGNVGKVQEQRAERIGQRDLRQDERQAATEWSDRAQDRQTDRGTRQDDRQSLMVANMASRATEVAGRVDDWKTEHPRAVAWRSGNPAPRPSMSGFGKVYGGGSCGGSCGCDGGCDSGGGCGMSGLGDWSDNFSGALSDTWDQAVAFATDGGVGTVVTIGGAYLLWTLFSYGGNPQYREHMSRARSTGRRKYNTRYQGAKQAASGWF